MAEDKPLNIKIDPDALTIEDMALIMSASEMTNTKALIPQIVDMMKRVVIGGIKGIPARRFQEVFMEVVKQWGESANPPAPAG